MIDPFCEEWIKTACGFYEQVLSVISTHAQQNLKKSILSLI